MENESDHGTRAYCVVESSAEPTILVLAQQTLSNVDCTRKTIRGGFLTPSASQYMPYSCYNSSLRYLVLGKAD